MVRNAKSNEAPVHDPVLVKMFSMTASAQGKTYEQNVAELIAKLDAAVPGMVKAQAQKKARQARTAGAKLKTRAVS